MLVALTVAVCVLALHSTALAAATVEEARPARVPLPSNISVDKSVRPRLEVVIAASQTLRRQFAAIAAAPADVEVCVSPAPLPGFRRAETSIARYSSGRIRAVVAVPPGADFIELLAHELEHVVEQIEGVDLDALVRAGRANRDRHGVYETDRADAAGRAAALEVQQSDSGARRTD